jgi:hypothetical protein
VNGELKERKLKTDLSILQRRMENQQRSKYDYIIVISCIGLGLSTGLALGHLQDNVQQRVQSGQYIFHFVDEHHKMVEEGVTGRINHETKDVFIETGRNYTDIADTCRHEMLHTEPYTHEEIYDLEDEKVMPLCDKVLLEADTDKIEVG